jgi:hypothetical protein
MMLGVGIRRNVYQLALWGVPDGMVCDEQISGAGDLLDVRVVKGPSELYAAAILSDLSTDVYKNIAQSPPTPRADDEQARDVG